MGDPNQGPHVEISGDVSGFLAVGRIEIKELVLPTVSAIEGEAVRSRLVRGIVGPAPHVKHFSVRERLVKYSVKEMLSRAREGVAERLFVTGSPGVGKSQFVLQMAWQLLPHFETILWIDCTSRPSIVSSWRVFAGLSGVPESIVRSDPIAAGHAACSTFDRLLIAADGVDSTTFSSGDLPTTRPGHALLSTTADLSLRELGRVIPLRPLTVRATANWLFAEFPTSQTDELRRLAGRIGGMPVAVQQVISDLRATGMTVREYADESGVVTDAISAQEQSGALVQRSVNALVQTLNAPQREVLALLSCAEVEAVSWGTIGRLRTLMDHDSSSERDVRLLCAPAINRSLVELNRTRSGVRIHGVVRNALRQALGRDELNRFLRNLLDSMTRSSVQSSHDAELAMQLLTSPLRDNLDLDQMLKLRIDCFSQLRSAGSYLEARWLSEHCPAAGYCEASARDGVLIARVDDAEALHDAGEHIRALAVLDDCLLESDAGSAVERIVALKESICFSLGRFNEALEIVNDELLALPEDYGSRRFIELSVSRGRGLRGAGLATESARLLLRVLRSSDWHSCPVEIRLRACANLGLALTDLSHPALAGIVYRAGLGYAQSSLPSDHFWFGNLYNNLGLAQMKSGDSVRAISNLTEALRRFAKQYGRDHFDTGIVANNLARALREAQRADHAIPFHQWALRTIRENRFQEAFVTIELAASLKSSGRGDQAAKQYERAVQLASENLPQDHPTQTRIREVGRSIFDYGPDFKRE